jgi:hypothetical protein
MTEDLRLESLRTAELVKVFADLAVEMEKANIEARTARYKALFEQQMRVERELKGRDGDQRKALLVLYDYPNMEVRFLAAQATRSVAPVEARRALRRIHQSKWPQSGPAGMSLWAWDEGIWTPD